MLNLDGAFEACATLPQLPVTPAFARERRAAQVIVHLPGRTSVRLDARVAHGLAHVAAFDLVVDLAREQMVLGGRTVGLEGRVLPARVLAELARQPGVAVPPERLFEAVWRRPYRTIDANTLQAHISMLRRMLGSAAAIELGALGYRLPRNVRCVVLEAARRPVRRGAQNTIFDLARARGFIDRRTLRAWTGMSMASAHRELARLTAEGLLVRIGSGRGARYRPVEIA